MYKENVGWYVNINDQLWGPYASYSNQLLTESGKFAFSYTDNGIEYININGRIWGPFTSVYAPVVTNSGKFAFRYNENNQYYININGVVLGPYVNAYSPTIAENGEYSFLYSVNDGNWYKNNNGKESVVADFNLPYAVGDIEINSANKQHSFYSNLAYEYVVIDGKRTGNSPAMRAWYDKDRNSFLWTALEGKELVLYEYKF
jgi:hypothetical protein